VSALAADVGAIGGAEQISPAALARYAGAVWLRSVRRRTVFKAPDRSARAATTRPIRRSRGVSHSPVTTVNCSSPATASRTTW
jgi:hypothetical protein